MKQFNIFESAISEYCKTNGLDFKKVKALPKCGNDTFMYIQVLDKKTNKSGLLDETPAEIILTATKEKTGEIHIDIGKNALMYLA